MTAGVDPAGAGNAHAAPAGPYGGAVGGYGTPAGAVASPQVGYGNPATAGVAQAWASYGAALVAPRTSGKRASPVLIVFGVIVVLLVAAVGVLLFAAGGDEPAPLIPGWQLMEGGGVSIQLPSSYKGGNPVAEPEVVAEQLRAVGGDFRALQEWVKLNEDTLLLFAVDTEPSASGMVSNVNVVSDEVPSSISMEEYVASGVSQLPPAFEVQESGVVNVGTRTVGRLVVRFQAPDGQAGMQVAYGFKDGGRMHVVTFTTSAREWESRLPVFEQSAATFRQ